MRARARQTVMALRLLRRLARLRVARLISLRLRDLLSGLLGLLASLVKGLGGLVALLLRLPGIALLLLSLNYLHIPPSLSHLAVKVQDVLSQDVDCLIDLEYFVIDVIGC